MFMIYPYYRIQKKKNTEYTILLSFNKLHIKYIKNVTVMILLYHTLPISVVASTDKVMRK